MSGWMGALMGGIGAHQGMMKGFEEQDKERRDRQLAAETARYSPWTGMKPNEVKEASIGSRVAEGYAAGASAGKNFNNAPTQTGGGSGAGQNASQGGWAGESSNMGFSGQSEAPGANAGDASMGTSYAMTSGSPQGQSAWSGMGSGNSEYDKTAAYQEMMRRKMRGQYA